MADPPPDDFDDLILWDPESSSGHNVGISEINDFFGNPPTPQPAPPQSIALLAVPSIQITGASPQQQAPWAPWGPYATFQPAPTTDVQAFSENGAPNLPRPNGPSLWRPNRPTQLPGSPGMTDEEFRSLMADIDALEADPNFQAQPQPQPAGASGPPDAYAPTSGYVTDNINYLTVPQQIAGYPPVESQSQSPSNATQQPPTTYRHDWQAEATRKHSELTKRLREPSKTLSHLAVPPPSSGIPTYKYDPNAPIFPPNMKKLSCPPAPKMQHAVPTHRYPTDPPIYGHRQSRLSCPPAQMVHPAVPDPRFQPPKEPIFQGVEIPHGRLDPNNDQLNLQYEPGLQSLGPSPESFTQPSPPNPHPGRPFLAPSPMRDIAIMPPGMLGVTSLTPEDRMRQQQALDRERAQAQAGALAKARARQEASDRVTKEAMMKAERIAAQKDIEMARMLDAELAADMRAADAALKESQVAAKQTKEVSGSMISAEANGDSNEVADTFGNERHKSDGGYAGEAQTARGPTFQEPLDAARYWDDASRGWITAEVSGDTIKGSGTSANESQIQDAEQVRTTDSQDARVAVTSTEETVKEPETINEVGDIANDEDDVDKSMTDAGLVRGPAGGTSSPLSQDMRKEEANTEKPMSDWPIEYSLPTMKREPEAKTEMQGLVAAAVAKRMNEGTGKADETEEQSDAQGLDDGSVAETASEEYDEDADAEVGEYLDDDEVVNTATEVAAGEDAENVFNTAIEYTAEEDAEEGVEEVATDPKSAVDVGHSRKDAPTVEPSKVTLDARSEAASDEIVVNMTGRKNADKRAMLEDDAESETENDITATEDNGRAEAEIRKMRARQKERAAERSMQNDLMPASTEDEGRAKTKGNARKQKDTATDGAKTQVRTTRSKAAKAEEAAVKEEQSPEVIVPDQEAQEVAAATPEQDGLSEAASSEPQGEVGDGDTKRIKRQPRNSLGRSELRGLISRQVGKRNSSLSPQGQTRGQKRKLADEKPSDAVKRRRQSGK